MPLTVPSLLEFHYTLEQHAGHQYDWVILGLLLLWNYWETLADLSLKLTPRAYADDVDLLLLQQAHPIEPRVGSPDSLRAGLMLTQSVRRISMTNSVRFSYLATKPRIFSYLLRPFASGSFPHIERPDSSFFQCQHSLLRHHTSWGRFQSLFHLSYH